jgi:hypothetical protein
MRLSVWLIEFIKLLGGRRLHPLNAECPFCHRMVRLHYNKAGRRHLFAHARAYSRALYEGSRYCAHYTAKVKCVGVSKNSRCSPLVSWPPFPVLRGSTARNAKFKQTWASVVALRR